VFTQQSATAKVRVTILWDDGVTYDSGQLVVTAPPGGCKPDATTEPTTPPTTTCDRAVPPRTDCTPATTVPVIIAPPVTVTNPPTSPPDTVMPPTSSPVTSAPHAPPAVVHSSSTTVATVLPHTGAGDTAGMVVAALFAIFLGWVLVYSVKRRGVS
jgi:LPXTG-motif cell wall-anchored protein